MSSTSKESHLDTSFAPHPNPKRQRGHHTPKRQRGRHAPERQQSPAAHPVKPLVFVLSILHVFLPVAILQAAGPSQASDAPRPNIVLILCDDLGYADVGFNNGVEDVKTPSIDALASTGVIFCSAYVPHPFCGPSRMGMLTGRYPHCFGAPFNLPPSADPFDKYDNEGIPTSEILMGTMLQKAGYFTGCVGKWHLGFAPEQHPNKRGFDDFYGFLGGGHMYFPEKYGPIYARQKRNGKRYINEYIMPLEHNGKEVEETEYMTDALSREAARFVKEASGKGKPFFLYLSFNAPHMPLEAKQEDLAKFTSVKDQKRRTYLAMMYAVDRGVQRVVDSLKESNCYENTLIVFLSDNGGKIGGGSNNAPLARGKGSIMEGGFRTPMFMHWPKGLEGGKQYQHPVSALDFYPTFARLAGTMPANADALHGKDVSDAITSNLNAREGEAIFALRHWEGFHNVGIRQDQWKAVRRGSGAWELYDLEADIGEQNDVANENPSVVRRLVAKGRKWSDSHTRPRWFLTQKADDSWVRVNMPVYTSTFSLEPYSRASSNGAESDVSGDLSSKSKRKSREPLRKPPASAIGSPKKRSASDWTLSEWIEKEKVKWEKNGWRWDLNKVRAAFREIDADSDGLATKKERQAWYAKMAAQRQIEGSGNSANLKLDSKNAKKPNVLFIAIDDLRPELGCYGSPIAVTPNLDRLAVSGLLFNRAYCQQAICRPSRASLMTGTRPETTGLFHNYVALRELQPDILTLPQHFIANGYETAYVGKIFHNGDTDEANSWSREPVKFIKGIRKPQGAFRLPENIKLKADNFKEMYAKYGEAAKRGLASGPAYEKADVPDHAYPDGYNTLLAIETLKEMAAADKPFFLGMGFKLPHLNWCAPTKYWDLYDAKTIPIETAAEAPSEGAAMGLHASFELRVRSNIPKYGPISQELARTLKHAYLASTSYVDAQVGLLLKTLDDLDLRENTIIVVWGDHGWHLGDMGVWGKATNYEIATRVPLMVYAPQMKVQGATTDALVELVDIFPTLCELCGVNPPEHLEGHSFVPLLNKPDRGWKKAAFSQYPNPALREWAANPLSKGMRETWFGPLIMDVEQRIMDQQGESWNRELFEKHLMGYTMRTDRYRLVVWRDHRDPEAEPLFVELFDHASDPQETKNIAGEKPSVVAMLMKQMKAGWQATFEAPAVGKE